MDNSNCKKLPEKYVHMIFDVQTIYGQIICKAKILIHKHNDIEKWKNPALLKKQVIDWFRREQPEFSHIDVDAFYAGDLIPYSNPSI